MYNKYDSYKHEYDSQLFIASALTLLLALFCSCWRRKDEKKNDNVDDIMMKNEMK